MRRLLVTEVFPPQAGGSGRWLSELYRRLPHENLVIAAGQHPQQAEYDRVHDLSITRLPLHFSSWGLLGLASLKQYYSAYRALKKLVKQHRIEVLHCGKCLPEGLLAWFLQRRFGLPYICYVHGEELSIAAGSRELFWWASRVLRGAARVIANSQNTASLLRGAWGVGESQIRVLHPGADTEYFRPAPRSDQVRVGLGWRGRRVVLTVGRLQKRKGHDMLIRALPEVRRAVPDVLYAIIGDGEERAALEALVGQLDLGGHVQFLGEVPDATSLSCYQQCDLFALPNRQVGDDFEGFGMVLVEAQACGTPVLAGNSGGTSETMELGRTGFVIPCETPGPLASFLAELLGMPERLVDMGRAARTWAVQAFDWEALCRQAESLFEGATLAAEDN